MSPEQLRGALDRCAYGDALTVLPEIGAAIGYGRAIQILQGAWRAQAIREGREAGADYESRLVCVWCHTDSRTGKKYRKTRKP
ncbi:MAG: hypothetical protein WBL29_17640 [Burkholderiales bacterium]